MANMDVDEDLSKKYGLPPRQPSPSLLGELQPGDEVVQPPPSYSKPVVKEADVEIVDLADSDSEEDGPGGRTTPPVPRNPQIVIKMEQQGDDSDDEIHFIGATTSKTPRPPPPIEIKTEKPDNEEIPSSNHVSSSVAAQTDIINPRPMDSTNPPAPACPEPPAAASVGKQGGTDEDWDHDPDWDSRQSSISSTTRLLPTTHMPASTAATSASQQKSPPITATSSTSIGPTVFSTETATTQPSQSVAHQFVVPDVPGLSLGSEKAKTNIQEVRLILNDGSTKRFIEVDGAREKDGDNGKSSKTLISGAYQTGESIINGEPVLRIPIDLNLPPVRLSATSGRESRKRPHEDSSRNTRDVRPCGTQSRNRTSTRSEDYKPQFSTPKDLIDLMLHCVECEKKFQSRREAVDHQKQQHSKKFCPYCYHLFTRKGSTLKEHFTACHVTNFDEETSPCFFCAKDKSGPKKEFNFDGLYQHLSKAHLVPVEVARNNNGRMSPDLPNLTPHIIPTGSSYRPPPIVYLPSANDDIETGPSLTLEDINNFGGNSNKCRKRNPFPTINQTRPTRTTARANVPAKQSNAPTTQNSATTWRTITNESKGLEEQKEVRQSRSSTVRPSAKSTEHTERSKDKSKVNPPQIPQSSREPQKSTNNVVNTRSGASKNNAQLSSPKTNAESSRSSNKTSQLPKNTSVQISKNRTSSPEASSSIRKSSSPAKVNGTSSESSRRPQSQTPGTTSASRTSNQTTQQTDAPEDRTNSRTDSTHENGLSREVKDAIKLWWKKAADEENRYPNFPNCEHIDSLAVTHNVTFESVQGWFKRHTEKRKKKTRKEAESRKTFEPSDNE